MILALAAASLAASCDHQTESELPPRPKPVDAGSPADCQQACAHLTELGCEEAQPSPPSPDHPEGESCTEVCTRFEASGIVTLNPACVVMIAACSEIETKCSYGQSR